MSVQEKKEEVLRICISSFAKNGYSKVSLSEIAKKASIPESTLYRLFESKEGILIDIFNKFWDKFLEEIRGVADDRFWSIQAFDKLKEIVISAQKIVNTDFDLVKIIASTRLEPPEKIKSPEQKRKRVEIRKKHREVLKLIDKIIVEGQKNKQITTELNSQVIRQILIGSFQALVYGFFIQSLRKNEITYSANELIKGINYLLHSFLLRE